MQKLGLTRRPVVSKRAAGTHDLNYANGIVGFEGGALSLRTRSDMMYSLAERVILCRAWPGGKGRHTLRSRVQRLGSRDSFRCLRRAQQYAADSSTRLPQETCA